MDECIPDSLSILWFKNEEFAGSLLLRQEFSISIVMDFDFSRSGKVKVSTVGTNALEYAGEIPGGAFMRSWIV
tara:strand:+ start:564 stop:782 length:219 start_codon:yes stop_codon:yes gene_type:complete